MSKIDDLNDYIEQCDTIKNSYNEQKDFIKKIIAIYEAEIPKIAKRLDFFWHSYETQPDLNGDIDKLKAILINYKSNIELEEQKRKDELEIARLKQANISLINSSSSNSTNTNNIYISLEQVMDCISKIPDELMSKDEKDELEDKISGIDAAVNSGKKDKAKDKILSVLKFLTDKGADALIALLPYLGQMAGLLK